MANLSKSEAKALILGRGSKFCVHRDGAQEIWLRTEVTADGISNDFVIFHGRRKPKVVATLEEALNLVYGA